MVSCFFGQRNHAKESEEALGVTEVDFVHGVQFEQGALRCEVGMPH